MRLKKKKCAAQRKESDGQRLKPDSYQASKGMQHLTSATTRQEANLNFLHFYPKNAFKHTAAGGLGMLCHGRKCAAPYSPSVLPAGLERTPGNITDSW